MCKAQIPPCHLQNPSEDSGSEQVLEAKPLAEGIALLHQARHQQGGGAGG